MPFPCKWLQGALHDTRRSCARAKRVKTPLVTSTGSAEATERVAAQAQGALDSSGFSAAARSDLSEGGFSQPLGPWATMARSCRLADGPGIPGAAWNGWLGTCPQAARWLLPTARLRQKGSCHPMPSVVIRAPRKLRKMAATPASAPCRADVAQLTQPSRRLNYVPSFEFRSMPSLGILRSAG